MSEYTIRPAEQTDAETIKQMVRSEPLNPNAIDWRYFLVLEIIEDGKPKIVSIGLVSNEEGIYELDSVTTRPEYRGKGYAAAIVNAWLERTTEPIYLLAETDLVAYYERLGFRLLKPEESPQPMIEQVQWLDRMFGDRVKYHIMGNPDK